MKTGDHRLMRFFGFKAQGDIGPITCYTSRRNKLVCYLRSPPEQPPSFLQISQRNVFRAAAATWRNLPPESRAKWREASTKAHLRISGYSLWTFLMATGDGAIIRTVEKHSGITLLP